MMEGSLTIEKDYQSPLTTTMSDGCHLPDQPTDI